MEMLFRVANLIVKELIQFRRDRLLSMFIVLAPALQLILLAQAIQRGVSEQPVVVLDWDRSAPSRRLMAALDNTEELIVRYDVQSEEEMRQLLDQGKARLAVVIPGGFARELSSEHSPQRIEIIADATNTVAASNAMSAATGVIQQFSSDLVAASGLVIPEFIDFRTNVRFNPTLDFRDFSIPAQIGFITYQVTLAVASLGLARERELGTLEQLMVTPLRSLDLAFGKGLPALAIGGLNFAVMMIIGLVVFRMPMNGSTLLLVALTVAFIVAVVGVGLIISTLSRTQQQAILLVFIVAMVEFAFSGYLVPVRNMPATMQVFSRLAPLQHYLSSIRAIVLKGAGMDDLWLHLVALLGISFVAWAVALRSIGRRVE
jgi:ABC-2 type transport system permease protein